MRHVFYDKRKVKQLYRLRVTSLLTANNYRPGSTFHHCELPHFWFHLFSVVLSSEKLRLMLHTILEMGNFMNQVNWCVENSVFMQHFYGTLLQPSGNRKMPKEDNNNKTYLQANFTSQKKLVT